MFKILLSKKRKNPEKKHVQVLNDYLKCSEKSFLIMLERIGLTNICIKDPVSPYSFEFTANSSDNYICQISPENYDEFAKLNLQNTSKKITAIYECTTHNSSDGIPVLTLINTEYLTDNSELSLSFYEQSNYIYIIKDNFKLQLHLEFSEKELANSCKDIILSNIYQIVSVLTDMSLKSSINTIYDYIINTIGLPINLINSSIIELELFLLNSNSKNEPSHTKIASYVINTGKIMEYSNYCFDTMTSVLVKSNNTWKYTSNSLIISFNSKTGCKNISVMKLTDDLRLKTLETIYSEKEALISEYWKYLN